MNKPLRSVGFTGTGDESALTLPRRRRLQIFLQTLKEERGFTVFHHGDCVGADAFAHELAKALDYFIIVHPPENPRKRAFCEGNSLLAAKPYLERNRDIVDDSYFMIAMPKNIHIEELRSGTWATVRYARKIGKEIEFI